MSDWIDVGAENALAEGEHLVVEIKYRDVAVFRLSDGYYAIEDVCTHDETEIASGEIYQDQIICPRHGARFCLKTGQVKCGPAYESVKTYPVRIHEGRIQVGYN
jgi:3-phenylpropionate/trans-cinnamate dioxygenase ferredoxin component